MGVFYQRLRRPVWVSIPLGFHDLQGAIPRFWCLRCGSEVFFTGKLYCHRCEKEDERNERSQQSLQDMHKGV